MEGIPVRFFLDETRRFPRRRGVAGASGSERVSGSEKLSAVLGG